MFVRDRLLGTTEALTVTPNTPLGPDSSSAATSISADGRFAAFSTDADNIVPGDGNDDTDVFVRDRATDRTVRVSVRTDGTETAFEEGTGLGGISANGQVVAMQSEAADLAPGGDAAIDDIFVHDERAGTANPADLTVSITDTPDPVRAGSRLTYTAAVTNNGPASASATLTDTLPANVRFRSATSTAGSCSRSGQVVTCSLGTLGTGDTATVTITVTPRQAGTITNSAQVTSAAADPNPTNNTDTETTTVTTR